jgi:histidinol-phosphate/aromatic aminotransferase/cobyric acid decarboxylase-like protein
LGQVVEDVEKELRPALENAFRSHERYKDAQHRAFAYTFHTQPDSTAAERGADAIIDFLARPGAGSSGAA